ncbi:MAG: hypothetical protein K5762_07845 [Bacilli bacterium]|nr:hypothetical protein [Bacilli bacterium]
MKVSKPVKILSSLLFVGCLTSCFFFNPNYSFDWGHTSTNTSTNASTSAVAEYKTPEYNSTFTTDNMNKDNIGLGFGYRYMPSIGNSKILVIPIQTTDSKFSSDYKERLDAAFFGDKSETGWESVTSFYEESSYGQLHISGEVTTAVTLNLTTAQLEAKAAKASESKTNYTDAVLDSALAAIAEKTDVDLSEYDTDGDKYIDAVWMVYSPSYNTNSDLYWAYTTWSSSTTRVNGLNPCCYAWASIDFLDAGGYVLPDAHTYIHETGHMMGLDDYYSYDYSPSDYNYDTPLGGVDMMDFNIGDHNSFSKYLLGWKRPTVITKEYLEANDYTVTLSSLVKTGSSYLIPTYKDGESTYNNTPFDEYLLLDYYTPTDLNYQDSRGSGYAGRLATYTQPGIALYHVNATIGKISATGTGLAWDGYAYDKLPSFYSTSAWGRTFVYTYLYSNTTSYCYDQSLGDQDLTYYRGRLLSLVPATGQRINGVKTGYASYRSLYRSGSSFNSNTYSTFAFDDGTKPAFGFTVSKTSSSDCTIKFTDF